MKRIDPIDLSVAHQLIDFGRGTISQSLAAEQLEGSVALHNILAEKGFAYLADEVGMGKTYVALGVVGLLRFFNPGLRVLFIAPRENIQVKWTKELGNFTRNNWRQPDERVRSLQDTPAVQAVLCRNLEQWGEEAVRNPDRDFFLRMSSFSLPLTGDDRSSWEKKRQQLEKLVPHLPRGPFNLSNKEEFKRNYARAINTILPDFDLVIVDEAHNLKQGQASRSSRNQVLARILGLDPDTRTFDWPGYGRRCDRVLFLSATPLETDYAELWRQIDLFGFGEQVKMLDDPVESLEKKRDIVGSFMVRRITSLQIAGEPHTKNMYRREWRGGGCFDFDQSLDIPGDRQRLVVALIQKKVAEALNNTRFNARFQIGMLSSFESFFQTAKVKLPSGEEVTFDGDQSEQSHEQDGLDTSSVNAIAGTYKRRFGQPLPHPKMDAVVSSLKGTFEHGEKTLIFVRRINSVTELQQKLCVEYDHWILRYIRELLPELVQPEFDTIWERYLQERETGGNTVTTGPIDDDEIFSAEEHEPITAEIDEDEGGRDTFYSWFFRGSGPRGILSGAAFRKNRLQGEASAYSTFFEDNHLWALLDQPESVLDALSNAVRMDPGSLAVELRARAYPVFESGTRQKKFPRLRVFHAYQFAGLAILVDRSSRHREQAQAILQELHRGDLSWPASNVPVAFPAAEDFVNSRTFFTELRKRPELLEALWPTVELTDLLESFRSREQRRELIASVARLGHSLITLWALLVRRLGSMGMRVQERRTEDRSEALINDFLDHLAGEQRQELAGAQRLLTAFSELRDTAQHFDLLMDTNFSKARREPLGTLSRYYASALSGQTPVAGMSGRINTKVVQQFRMPGYPIVLITTDVLQEGEDLHTFCSRVIHYGITWTPSAMEQRTGRVDRVNSQAHRRLESGSPGSDGSDLLQVYFPYLKDSVELLQVQRVFGRMNQFLQKTHVLGRSESVSRFIDANEEFTRQWTIPPQLRTPLRSAFPVVPKYLKGKTKDVTKARDRVTSALKFLAEIERILSTRLYIEWESYSNQAALYGTVYSGGNGLAPAGCSVSARHGMRRQPFTLFIRSASGGRVLLLHAVSPVGKLPTRPETLVRWVELARELSGAKICQVVEEKVQSYTITIEGDILFDPSSTQIEEVVDLLRRVAVPADRIEQGWDNSKDAPFSEFESDLVKEGRHAED